MVACLLKVGSPVAGIRGWPDAIWVGAAVAAAAPALPRLRKAPAPSRTAITTAAIAGPAAELDPVG